MEHHHSHEHIHTITSLNTIFIVCILINLAFVIIEAGVGFFTIHSGCCLMPDII